jgi:hypothetical protein
MRFTKKNGVNPERPTTTHTVQDRQYMSGTSIVETSTATPTASSVRFIAAIQS